MYNTLVNFFSFDSTNSVKKFKNPEQHYSCLGVIHRITPSALPHLAALITFTDLPDKYFYCGPANIDLRVGNRVHVQYKTIVVNTYFHFWITSIENIIYPPSLRRRHNILVSSDVSQEHFVVDCGNCSHHIPLNTFKRCTGHIIKHKCDSWFSDAAKYSCNVCDSQFGGSIGEDCRRESVMCPNCGMIQNI